MKRKELKLLSPEIRTRRFLTPQAIAIIYAIMGGLWIVASDSIVSMMSKNPAVINRLQTYKGWFFIAMTAAMLYSLIRVYGKKNLRDLHTLRESEARNRLLVENVRDYEDIYD